MIALIVSNIAWASLTIFLVTQGLGFHRKQVALADAREDARDANHREHVRSLENQIVLLKVSPPTAAAQAASDVEMVDAYISPTDDEALAQYELDRIEAR